MPILTLCALLIGFPFLASAAESEPFKLLSVEEVSAQLGKPDIFVFDANSKSTYKKRHVPGAKHLKPNSYTESELPQNKEATLIFYCYNPH